ncbi:hypothetical protein [Arthrobacter sp. STN4]|uniref:hypothetical protein n=1 Tax=Arthrobacter sp. STN4 TaxID=2923276 RepID=UPI00211A5028|nr:hypothetical protein [Arthrobacter sp. STN4]MCQ9164193.1 hypothetical protein [Arthrobacter sp. STN4]
MQPPENTGNIQYSAEPGTVAGDENRSIHGTAYKAAQGYLFRDQDETPWWIIYSPTTGTGSGGAQQVGDILSCSESTDELVTVRVLARNVLQRDADNAFLSACPATYEEATRTASQIPTQSVTRRAF